jgi:hypothetical protein
VSNEPATLNEAGDKVVQVVDGMGEPFAWVLPVHCHGHDWNAATARAALVAEALNAHQPGGMNADAPEGYSVAGSCLALAQSLHVMAEQADGDGRSGWAVITRRAEGFVRKVALSVTRFLAQPDLRVMHPEHADALVVDGCSVQDSGAIWVTCRVQDGPVYRYPLDTMVPVGPVADAVRVAVRTMMGAVAEDMVGQLVAKGMLPGVETMRAGPAAMAEEVLRGHSLTADEANRLRELIDTCAFAHSERDANGDLVDVSTWQHDEAAPKEVHHLAPHSEYVMHGAGVGTVPSKAAPMRDEDNGLTAARESAERELCPDCHLPLHSCICVPMDD